MKLCCTVVKSPTAITHSAIGNFTPDGALNLLVAKISHIDVYKYSQCHLSPVLEIPIYGKIEGIKLFTPEATPQFPDSPSDSSRQHLLVYTNRYDFIIIECIEENDEPSVRTVCHGSYPDCFQQKRHYDGPPVADVMGSCIVFQLNSHLLKVVEIEQCGLTFRPDKNIHTDDNSVVAFAFVSAQALALLYDRGEHRDLIVREICLKSSRNSGHLFVREKIYGDYDKIFLTNSPNKFILYGRSSVAYVTKERMVRRTSPCLRNSQMKCFAAVGDDETRFIMGDFRGLLHYVILLRDCEGVVNDINVGTLGGIPVPSTLQHLGNGVVFIGSQLGNSRIVQLVANRDPKNGWITPLSDIPNIGPILDMAFAGDRLLLCSGYRDQGSLNILQRGVGFEEELVIGQPWVNYIAPLSIHDNSSKDYVLISSNTSSCLIKMNGEVEVVPTDWLNPQMRTIYCQNTSDDIILINPVEILLVKSRRRWIAPNEISMASSDTIRILCASFDRVHYLVVQDGEIWEKDSRYFGLEVSALSLMGDVFSVAFWDNHDVHIYKLLHLEHVCSIQLNEGPSVIFGMTLLSSWSSHKLICSTIDGYVAHIDFDPSTGMLSNVQGQYLSDSPTYLCKIMTEEDFAVLACSSSSAQMRYSNDKLITVPVKSGRVRFVANWNSSHHLISDGERIILAKFELRERFHCRNIPLDHSPRRIAYDKANDLILLVTTSEELLSSCHYSCQSSLLAMDGQVFEVLHCQEFGECAHSLLVISPGLFALGLSHRKEDKSKKVDGRICTFRWKSPRVVPTGSLEVHGVTSHMRMCGDMLVATIDCRVELFTICEDRLQLSHSVSNYVNCTSLGVLGDKIIIGDLLESVVVFTLDDGELVKISAEEDVRSIANVAFVTEDLFLATDNNQNMLIYGEGSRGLRILSLYYFGDSLNVFLPGHLNKFYSDSKLIFGTASGAVGSIRLIDDEDDIKFYSSVVSSVLCGYNNARNKYYDRFRRECCSFPKYYSYPHKPDLFIDGNILLSVLHMNSNEILHLIRRMEEQSDVSVSSSELMERIEQFSLNC